MIDSNATPPQGGDNQATRTDQFIAMLGHDLRNPLHSILAGAEMLERHALPPKSERLAHLIRASGERMNTLIDLVLDFTRGELTGKIALSRRPASDLSQVLETGVQAMRLAHPDRDISMDFQALRSRTIYCDPARVNQALASLVSNALRHGQEGGAVAVTASVQPGRLVLAVFNRGNPITASLIGVLCDPSLRPPIGHGREGLGLGLYVVAKIAEGHDGELTIASSESDGTTVSLIIPMAE